MKGLLLGLLLENLLNLLKELCFQSDRPHGTTQIKMQKLVVLPVSKGLSYFCCRKFPRSLIIHTMAEPSGRFQCVEDTESI